MLKWHHFITTNKFTIIAFLTVGSTSAIINVLSFAIFFEYTRLNYNTAISISYILSVIFHFIANRHFTFKSHHIQMYYQVPKYLTVVVLNYVVTLIMMYFIIEVMHLSPYIGNVAAIAMTVGTSYFLSKYWVFNTY